MATEFGASAEFEPLVKSVTVRLGPERAFGLFTEQMGTWWPLHRHSIAQDTFEGAVTAERLVFEGRLGGSIYEVMSDGRKGEWGKVLDWDPPHRVVFSWKPNLSDSPPTEVEVRFQPSGDSTVVILEHRGWERLGDAGAALRNGYDQGWPGVLALFADHCADLR